MIVWAGQASPESTGQAGRRGGLELSGTGGRCCPRVDFLFQANLSSAFKAFFGWLTQVHPGDLG